MSRFLKLTATLLAVLLTAVVVIAANDSDFAPGRVVVHSTYGSSVSCTTATSDGSICAEQDIESADDMRVGDDITIVDALTCSGGADAITFSDSASAIVIPDNDTTALDIGSTGATNLLRFDTGNSTETVIVDGTTTVLAFEVAVGTASFAEAVTVTGDLTCSGGAGAITLTDTASSVLLPDNDATALDVGATGATAMLRFQTTNSQESIEFRANVIQSPAVFDTFGEGASKGLATLQHDGTAFDGTAGVVNQAYTSWGNVFNYVGIVGQTLDVSMTAVGLDIGMDQTDNDGVEIYGGVNGASGRPFIIGTDPAFKFCATVKLQLTNGTDDFHIGFRRAGAINATFDDYLDLASIGIVTVADPAAIQLETILNNGATTTTNTNDTWADATAKKFCILVGATGAVTYTNDGAAPTATAAFTFDDGDPVIPFIHMLQANAAQTGTAEITEWEVAYQ